MDKIQSIKVIITAVLSGCLSSSDLQVENYLQAKVRGTIQ